MTLEEKLHLFSDSAIANATEKSNMIMEEYKKNLEKSLEEYKISTKQKAEATFQSEMQKLIQEKNRKLSVENTQFKRELIEKTASLKESLFSDVQKKLEEYMQTDAYIQLLEQQISSLVATHGTNHVHIYLNVTDLDKKAALEAKTNTSLLIDETNFIGGIKAVIEDKNILIDSSFLTKLEEQKEAFSL